MIPQPVTIITQMLDRIAGSPEEAMQEHRLFNATSFTGILVIVSIIIPNYFLGLLQLAGM
jgi:hypothetical protein